MEENNQEGFLGKIRSALGGRADVRRENPELFKSTDADDYPALLEKLALRTGEERKALLDRLTEEGALLNLKVIPCKDKRAAGEIVAEIVAERSPEWGSEKSVVAWRHPLVEALELPFLLEKQNVPLHYIELSEGKGAPEQQRIRLRKAVENSFIGVTSADYCLADTASLVMRTRPGQARSVSLVPSIHIAVIEIEQLLADLKEFYAILKWDPAESAEGPTNCMTFISGPSKTADIEATMVHGAHGPRELCLIVITG